MYNNISYFHPNIVAIVGLSRAMNEVGEGESVAVVVELQYGELDKDVTIHISTEDGTAQGKFQLVYIYAHSLHRKAAGKAVSSYHRWR